MYDLLAGPRMAAVGAWPVPWSPYGRCGGVVVPRASYGCREGVAGPLSPVWLQWGRFWFYGPHMVDLGVASFLGPVWPPWSRGRSPGSFMVAVKACPVPGPHVAVVGARPVVWVLYGRHWVVAGPHCLVWPPWVRGQFPVSRITTLGAWPIP